MEELKRLERESRERKYQAWCSQLDSLPDGFKRSLQGEFIADVELQPRKWIELGLDLIGVGVSDLPDGERLLDFMKYLPYPVFQAGTESFLKGMWLYQFEECRKLESESYVSLEYREKRDDELRGLSKPKMHDVLRMIQKVQSIDIYKRDPQMARFLKRLDGICRRFYHPFIFIDDEKSWANERYPRRFYNDSTKQASVEFVRSYPVRWLVIRLFSEAAERIESLWETPR